MNIHAIPGWFLLLSLTASYSVLAGTDDLVQRLTARRNSLGMGHLSYVSYELVTNTAGYKELHELISPDFPQDKLNERFGKVRATLERIVERPIRAHNGEFWYKDGRSRETRQTISEFISLWEKKGGSQQHRKPSSKRPELEQITFDGRSVAVLEDKTLLYRRDKMGILNYNRIHDFDISMAPWIMVRAKGPNVNQTIVASKRKGLHVVTFKNDAGSDKENWADYAFDPALGYAPRYVRGYGIGGWLAYEVTYSYLTDRTGGLRRPRISCFARFKPKHKRATFTINLVSEWSDQVSDEDLRLKLPPKYTIMDER